MGKLHIKKGDTVIVTAGESKGAKGEVLNVDAKKMRATVSGEGIKKIKKHTKPNAANPQGGIVELEATIHISNIMLVDPKSGNATRVGRKVENEKLVRYAKKSGEVIK